MDVNAIFGDDIMSYFGEKVESSGRRVVTER